MENNQFEDSFKDAFNGAEISPAAGVWTNIELDLEKASGGQLKRNLLLFQLLAAASVVFALGIGAVYYLDHSSGNQPKVQQALQTPAASNSTEMAKGSSNESKEKNGPLVAQTDKRTDNKTGNDSRTVYQSDVKQTAITAITSDPEQTEIIYPTYKISKAGLLSFTKTRKPALMLPEPEAKAEADPVMIMMARLKDEEKKYQEEDKKAKSNEKTWASFGVGAGSYKPNREVLSNGTASSGSVTGQSYSLAINVASKISKRVIIQSGISYVTQNADFTSNVSNGSVASLQEYNRPKFDAVLDHTSGLDGGGKQSYEVNSSLQFVSIPVQAGYMIVDKAFGIQLNGGISTDVFISNTLTPETNEYNKVTQSAGKDSPYRTVNFSGLAGTEFSYKIADQYRISLNPGLRYSLNSIYKQGVAAEITPVTFDVSLRVRYVFK